MMLLSQRGYPFALVVAALLLIALFWLLRTQRLREKYSVLWFAVIVGVVLLTFIPAITGWLTALAGVTTPINLVFILAFLVLLVVCIQLSIEISTLEESADGGRGGGAAPAGAGAPHAGACRRRAAGSRSTGGDRPARRRLTVGLTPVRALNRPEFRTRAARIRS
jgi:hypothetical protein